MSYASLIKKGKNFHESQDYFKLRDLWTNSLRSEGNSINVSTDLVSTNNSVIEGFNHVGTDAIYNKGGQPVMNIASGEINLNVPIYDVSGVEITSTASDISALQQQVTDLSGELDVANQTITDLSGELGALYQEVELYKPFVPKEYTLDFSVSRIFNGVEYVNDPSLAIPILIKNSPYAYGRYNEFQITSTEGGSALPYNSNWAKGWVEIAGFGDGQPTSYELMLDFYSTGERTILGVWESDRQTNSMCIYVRGGLTYKLYTIGEVQTLDPYAIDINNPYRVINPDEDINDDTKWVEMPIKNAPDMTEWTNPLSVAEVDKNINKIVDLYNIPRGKHYSP